MIDQYKKRLVHVLEIQDIIVGYRWASIANKLGSIGGAIAIVLAIKAWVVNPYRIPTSSMEPTLHCARPASWCEARFSDRVLANRFIYHFRDPQRGDVVVFETPPQAKTRCGAGGTFVKRIIGLPGERLQMRLIKGAAFVYIDGSSRSRTSSRTGGTSGRRRPIGCRRAATS